jgi:hypothetical protein
MAGTRSESWWQPPKDFEAPVDPEEVLGEAATAEQDDQEAAGWHGWGGAAPQSDATERSATNGHDRGAEIPVGWTSPTGNVAKPEMGNRRFYLGVALIVAATAIGVAVALSLAPDDGPDTGRSAATDTPTAVRGETTVRRPGALSTACLDEKSRIQRAEQTYQRRSTSHQYTDMSGLVSSRALAAPSSWFVVVNENPGTPPIVQVDGAVIQEFEDFLVVPVPGGPCDTTT